MSWKKILAGVIACCVVGGTMPSAELTADNNINMVTAVAYDDYTSGTYESLGYKNYGDHITITNCDSSATEVVIPDEIEGVPVTNIGYGVFKNCENLTGITIPDSVTFIGSYVFWGCTSLESVTLPDSITSIGYNAFQGCTGLTEVTIPDSVTSIESSAFEGCTGLTSITIPDGVTSIESSAFEGCTGLTEVTIPDGVTSIDYSVFQECTGLTEITIPDSVTSIESSAFWGCTGLTAINVSEDNENYAVVDGVLFNKDKTKIIQYPSGKAESEYIIPDSVTSVDGVFSGCTNLESITIPDSVTELGDNAFRDCTGLKSITIPDSITTIGRDAFKGCTGLTELNIPASVTYLGGAFCDGCTSLTAINVDAENTVYYSDDGVLYRYVYEEYSYMDDKTAVYNNALLVFPQGKQGEYTIKDDAERIGAYAFENCAGITAVNIPESVTSVGYNAFFGCTNLSSVNIAGSTANELSIGGGAFYDCTCLEEIDIPSNVIEIGYYAFYNCTNLASVNIAGSADKEMSIGGCAFSNCTSLEEIKIPYGVTEIESNAFTGCTSLKSMEIPASITYVGVNSTAGCTALEEINVDDGSDVYYSYDGALYKNAEIDAYNYDDNTWTTSTYKSLIACPEGKQGVCNIKDGTERIASYAFVNCAGVTEVSVSDTVKYINYRAFSDCTNLEKINISSSVEYIANFFCDGCSALKEINVDNGNDIYYSDKGVLYKNYDVIVYNSETESEETAAYKVLLAYPEGRQGSYTIKDGTDSVGAYAFENCESLKSVSIPKSVTNIISGKATISNGFEEVLENYYGYEYYVPDPYFNGTICGYTDTISQLYAEQCGYKFAAIDAVSDSDKGDVDGDGKVDSSDASLVLTEYSLLSTGYNSNFSEVDNLISDLNKDGKTDSSDASLILAYYSHVSTGGEDSIDVFLKKAGY